MSTSLRRQEGYLLIDHRMSPGVPDALLHASGLEVVSARGGATFESATSTCSHCHAIVVANPDRSRARAYCPGCHHYICDGCEFRRVQLGHGCVPLVQILDDLQNQAVRLRDQSSAGVL